MFFFLLEEEAMGGSRSRPVHLQGRVLSSISRFYFFDGRLSKPSMCSMCSAAAQPAGPGSGDSPPDHSHWSLYYRRRT